MYEADAFARREFSFTSEDDMYTRHLSFPDAEQWQQHVVNKQPYKIDIGAVYSFAVRRGGSVLYQRSASQCTA